MSRRQLGAEAHRFGVAVALDFLREIIGRTDALVSATEHHFERFGWRSAEEDDDGDDDRRVRLEHMAHLLGAAKEAARAAVMTGDTIATELVKRRTRA